MSGEVLGRRRSTSGIYAVALSEIEARIVVVAGCFDGNLHLWDLHASYHATIEVGASIYEVVATPDGLVAVGTHAGIATLDLVRV